jgi:hypothetical protein
LFLHHAEKEIEMIKKRYIFIPLAVLMIGVLVIGVVGYVLLSRNGSDTAAVSGVTAVGLPNGPATKKSIGPAGGSIASIDGRINVTVPPNDLLDPVEFVVTPITNQAPGGFGNAYRLEPNGQKFTTPVEISFKYTEQELEGTIPDALMASYQEEGGRWRVLTNEQVDEAGKFLTVTTTHFTDMSLGRKYNTTSADKWDPSTHPIEALVATHFRVSPAKATIHPGESVRLDFIGCEDENGVMAWSEQLLRRWNLQTAEDRCFLNGVGYVWNTYYVKHGFGSVYPNFGPRVLYTAPSKKPFPNVVQVECRVMFNFGNKFPPPRAPNVNEVQGFWHYNVRVEGAEITIIDRGYTATGSDSQVSYSGTICDLAKPFTVIGHGGPGFTFKFTPSGDGRTGTGAISSGVYATDTWTGGGPYKIEGFAGDKPRIIWEVTMTVSGRQGKAPGSITQHIDLVPIDTDECKQP